MARLVSLLGGWFNTLAVLAVLRELGAGSASDFGWIVILKTLPALLVAPLAGVVSDRFPRRQVMIASDLLCALVVLSMLSLRSLPSVTWLYLLVALQSALGSFFEPARSALLPDLVEPEDLTRANALGAAAWSAMLALGSALGGLVTARFGWEVAMLIDVLSYLMSAVLLVKISEPSWRREASPGKHIAAELQQALRYLRRSPRALTLMAVKPAWCIQGSTLLVLTLLGEQVHTLGGEAMLGVTLLYFARGLGTGAGPFIAQRLAGGDPARMERLMLLAFLHAGTFYLLLSFAPNPWTAAICVLIAHFGGSTIWVFSSVRLQQTVPPQLRGRIFATEAALFTGAISASTWVYGQLSDHWGVAVTSLVRLLGCSLLIPAALWWLRGQRLGWGESPKEEARSD